LLIVAVVSYLWGGLTVYKQIFPLPQMLLLKYKYLDGSSPRQTMFQTISPGFDVAMIGDSLTAAAPRNEIFPKVQIANRGVGGDTTTKVLLRMDTILTGFPKKALIMVGINEFYRGRDLKIVFLNSTGALPALVNYSH
jgi:hypothetical protein